MERITVLASSINRREIASLAMDATGALASLALLVALSYIVLAASSFTLSGVGNIFHAEMAGIAKVTAAAIFVLVIVIVLFPIGKLWLVLEQALRSYLSDIRERVNGWMRTPSAYQHLADECVTALQTQLQTAGKHVRWVIQELELEVDYVTLAMVYYVLHLHVQHLRGVEQRTLEGVMEYLGRLIVSPAGDLFDRAVAEGASATQLIEDLLACGL